MNVTQKNFFALALGVGTKNGTGDWLEAYFPTPLVYPEVEFASCLEDALDYKGGQVVIEMDSHKIGRLVHSLRNAGLSDYGDLAESFRDSDQPRVLVVLESDEAPSSTLEVYLKLHLLSHRLLKPHQVNLQGIFSLMPTVAWTSQGAIDFKELGPRQTRARLQGECLEVFAIDKFPKMSNYVVPSGVRIADTARVRLGAYLGQGTTVMHEGFVNFNAGTLGVSMIEGRVSAGVTIGENSDLGGGSSTMGTLSGGNNVIISLGRECLVGANAGVGIPLGDRCTIEAGLYVTAGSKVHLIDTSGAHVKTVKARELADMSDLLFRRNSLTGAIEALSNKSAIRLNEELHKHN